MRALFLLPLLSLLVPGSGCLADRHGGISYTADAGIAVDTVVQDDAPHSQDVTPDACEPVPTVIAQGVLDVPGAPWHLAVSSASVVQFSADRWSEPAGGVRALDVTTGDVLLAPTPAGATDILLDARDGARLVTRLFPADRSAIVYVDEQGEVPLTDPDAGEMPWTKMPYPSAYPKMVGPRRAAWRSCGQRVGWECERSVIRGWLGGDGKTLWETPYDSVGGQAGPPPPPEVDEAGVVWVEPLPEGGGDRVRAWDGGEPRTLWEVDQTILRVARLGNTLVWIDSSGVSRLRPGAGVSELLAPGTCGALDYDGKRAVWLCVEPGAIPRSPVLPASGGDMWLYDGETARVVPTGGALTLWPRVDHELLAWLSYPLETDGCMDLGPGSVVVAPVAQPEHALVLSQIGIGCYCCNMIWPQLRVSFRDGLLAWNYVQPDTGDIGGSGDFGDLGWARLAPSQRCE